MICESFYEYFGHAFIGFLGRKKTETHHFPFQNTQLKQWVYFRLTWFSNWIFVASIVAIFPIGKGTIVQLTWSWMHLHQHWLLIFIGPEIIERYIFYAQKNIHWFPRETWKNLIFFSFSLVHVIKSWKLENPYDELVIEFRFKNETT